MKLTKLHAQDNASPTPVFTPARRGLLQRRCACGSSHGLTGDCEECGHQRMTLQRHAIGPSESSTASPIVHEVLGSPGQPLEAATRLGMESRFGHRFGRVSPWQPGGDAVRGGMSVGRRGDSFEREADSFAERVEHSPSSHAAAVGLERGDVNAPRRSAADFSRIRIHADGRAAEAAQSLGAAAFTAGRDIVFGRGRYAPETAEGRRLLAHELTHSVQQQTASGATPAIQRQALSYDKTAISIPPLPRGFTLIDSQNLVDKAKKATPPKLTSASVKGVTAASDVEIYLHYIIAQVAEADNWGTEHDLIAPIGWPAKAGGTGPVGKVTVTITSAGAATAELLSAGDVSTPTTHKSAASAITALKTTYGISKVTDDTAKWTTEHLNKVVAAFAFVPAGDRAALKGVELIRVDSLGGDTAGEFDYKQSVADTTVVNTATLTLADKAFEGDPVSFVGDASKASPASYETIVHEVAHAVEKKAMLDASHAQHQAMAKYNETIDKQTKAEGVLDPLVDAANAIVIEFNAATTVAEQAKIQPRLDAAKAKAAAAQKKLDAAAAASKTAKQEADDKKKLAEATLLSAASTAALKTDSQAKKTNFDTALATAQTAAGKFVAADSTAAASFIQAVSDATKVISHYVTAAAVKGADVDVEDEKVLKAFEKRDAERTALLKAAPKNPAPGAFSAAVTAQGAWFTAERTQAHAQRRTARLQKFVDFVTTNNISPFTPYAKQNWPFKPGEFYAEAYSLWRTDPVYLKTNAKVLFDWFEKGSYL